MQKHNNRKQTFDAVCRTLLFDIAKQHGLHLEQEPSYGGRADEHSISCISTAGVLAAMDTERFEPIPVGITKDGKWIIDGEDPRGWNLDGDELPTVKITPESRPVILDPSRGKDGFFAGEPDHLSNADSGFGTSFVSLSDPEMHHVLTSLGHVDAVWWK